MTPIAEIKTDESGELVTGHFYRLETFPHFFEKNVEGALQCVGGDEFIPPYFTLIKSSSKRFYRCPIDPGHYTGSELTSAKWDVLGGNDVPIATCSDSYRIVREDVYAALNKANLRGLRGVECEIAYFQGGPPERKYYSLCFEGCNLTRRIVTPPEANQCPNCRHGPILCPGCGEVCFWTCPRCERRCVGYESDSDDADAPEEPKAPIMFRREPNGGPVLDASRWDGTDFLRYSVATRRVVNKLLELHAFSFQAIPLRTFIGTCTPERLRELEKLKE